MTRPLTLAELIVSCAATGVDGPTSVALESKMRTNNDLNVHSCLRPAAGRLSVAGSGAIRIETDYRSFGGGASGNAARERTRAGARASRARDARAISMPSGAGSM